MSEQLKPSSDQLQPDGVSGEIKETIPEELEEGPEPLDALSAFMAGLEGKSEQAVNQVAEALYKQSLKDLFSLKTLVDPVGTLMQLDERMTMVRGAGEYVTTKQWDSPIERYHGVKPEDEAEWKRQRWTNALQQARTNSNPSE